MERVSYYLNTKYYIQYFYIYFYKFLIENSRDYAGFRVTKGRIDFVTPDNSGFFHSLELEFNDGEAEQIKKLIAVVYQRIKDLDFPELEEGTTTKAFIDSLLA